MKNQISKILFLLLLALILILLSCSKDKSSSPTENIIDTTDHGEFPIEINDSLVALNSSFYPLQLGNEWLYDVIVEWYDENADTIYSMHTIKEIITGDTLMDNGKKYFVIETEEYFPYHNHYSYDTDFYRFDSINYNLYKYHWTRGGTCTDNEVDDFTFKIDSLNQIWQNCVQHDTYILNEEYYYSDSLNLGGICRTINMIEEVYTWYFMKNIGLVYKRTVNPVSDVPGFTYHYLKYAKINGVEYGEK